MSRNECKLSQRVDVCCRDGFAVAVSFCEIPVEVPAWFLCPLNVCDGRVLLACSYQFHACVSVCAFPGGGKRGQFATGDQRVEWRKREGNDEALSNLPLSLCCSEWKLGYMHTHTQSLLLLWLWLKPVHRIWDTGWKPLNLENRARERGQRRGKKNGTRCGQTKVGVFKRSGLAAVKTLFVTICLFVQKFL